MSKPTGFHVRHDLQPELTQELLLLLQGLPEQQTKAQLQEAAQLRGYKLGERKDYNKIIRSLAELDLLTTPREPITLSDTGQIIAAMATFYSHLLPDFIHFIYYTSWNNDSLKRFSWAYQTVCNALWEAAPSPVDRAYLVSLVSHEAEQQFDLSGISFSTASIAGILNWVTALDPPCLTSESQQQIFSHRNYCSVELFTLALNHVYNIERADAPFVHITSKLRESVCRICLINPEAFDEMLNQAEYHFPKLQIRRERGERFAMSDFSWADIVDHEVPV